jgi:CBS domain-containing protein
MISIKQLLTSKKHDTIYSVRPDQMVIEALALMAEKNIGAVLVMDGAALVGIFSERDYARRGILQDRKAKSTPISEVMTPHVYTVDLQKNIEDCMKLMSERHFRHLPVVSEGNVVGIVSISDIVNAMIKEQSTHIQFLEQFIAG